MKKISVETANGTVHHVIRTPASQGPGILDTIIITAVLITVRLLGRALRLPPR